jgi:hypothetical protein
MSAVAAPSTLTLPGTWAWPDGSEAAAAMSCEQLGLQLQRALLAATDQPTMPMLARAADWPAFVQQRRPDDPVPLALASFGYRLAGDADGITRRAFGMAPLLHAPFGNGPAVLRSRVVRWWLDPRFFVGDGAFPTALQLDAGDGRGLQPVPADGIVTAFYASDVQQLALRLVVGSQQARCTIAIGAPPAPLPDLTLPFPGATAWVFQASANRAAGLTTPQRPVIVCEGFPGGYACDYLHDMMNQQGTLDAMLAQGHDVVLLGFAKGTGPIDTNATALMGVIRELDPLVVGGVSMGGLIARQAMAAMDAAGESHAVALFFTLDTPHQGAYTPLSVQWFVQANASSLGGAAGFAWLINSTANQQFMSHGLRVENGAWQAGPSPLRTAWLQRLADVGSYPTRPRKLALACGRGDGQRREEPGALQLQWDDGQGFSGTLHGLGSALPAGQDSLSTLPPLPAQPPGIEDTAWDGLPGSTNPYVALAAALLAADGLQPQLAQPMNLSIATVSALDIALPPGAPIPPDAPSAFDEWHFAEQDLPHLTLTPALRDALLRALPPAPCSAAPHKGP